MSELDIARLLNDKAVDFGNERFLEGWNGATEHIIKFLEETIIKGGNHGWSISTIIGILKEEIKGEK